MNYNLRMRGTVQDLITRPDQTKREILGIWSLACCADLKTFGYIQSM